MSIAKVEPVKYKEYEYKQSKYSNVMTTPFRACVVAPSGSGKTVLIQSLILDIYKNKFDSIYIFSPSIYIDNVFDPIINYIDNELTINYKSKEKYYFDEYDDDALFQIIETQSNIIKYYKENLPSVKLLPSILIIVDDFADDVKTMKHNQTLNSLFVRGRHSGISVLISSQKYYAISNIIRLNCTDLIVFTLQNIKDKRAVVEDISALASQKNIEKMYSLAVNDRPFSFFYIKLSSKTNEKFFIRFEKLMKINNSQ